jgi:hypothetical protein
MRLALIEEQRKQEELQRQRDELALKNKESQFKGVGNDWLNAANQVLGGPLTVNNMYGITPEQNAQINALAERERAAKGTKVTLNTGPNGPTSPLTEGARTQMQDKLEATRDTIFQIDELRKLGSPSRFLGAQSRVKNWALEQAAGVAPSQLSDEQKNLVADDRRFNEINYSIFNNMRRIVTGAGASEKELAQLRSTIVNTSLDPVSYEAALNRLEDFNRRAESTYSRLLRQGVDVGDPGYGQKFDAEMAKSARQYAAKSTTQEQAKPPMATPNADPIMAGAMRAVQAGTPPLQVVQRLVSQGAIDAKQARILLPQLAAGSPGSPQTEGK